MPLYLIFYTREIPLLGGRAGMNSYRATNPIFSCSESEWNTTLNLFTRW